MINRRIFSFGLLATACGVLCSCSPCQNSSQTPTTAGKAEQAVSFQTINQYFVKNTVHPEAGKTERQGVCSSQAEFDALFGPAALNQENQFLPDDFFSHSFILYYIQWGDTPWEYHVEGLTSTPDGLHLRISRTGEPSPNASFASCLLLGIDKSVPHESWSVSE